MSDDAVRDVLAGIGLEPGDLPPALLDVVTDHLREREPDDMGARLRAERDNIPARHRALVAQVLGVPTATPAEDSPDTDAGVDLGQGVRPVAPEPPTMNDVLRGDHEHSRRERAARTAEARQDRLRH